MLSRNFASSPLRLPRVFSCSMASRSMLCCAMGKSALSRFCPVVGSGASPRWMIALEPSERTSALKSSLGALDSSAICSPQIESEFRETIAALHQDHRLSALARLGQRLAEFLERIHLGAVQRQHQVSAA